MKAHIPLSPVPLLAVIPVSAQGASGLPCSSYAQFSCSSIRTLACLCSSGEIALTLCAWRPV